MTDFSSSIMEPVQRTKLLVTAATVAAIVGAIAFGISERLSDPLGQASIPAEDPYTHMILVRGHIHDGNLDAVFPGGTMYPPGMHALLATVWVYTGLDLYDVFRVGPVFFGAIGILGVGLLVSRYAGPLAGSVSALAAAIAPELIFRTTMMAPTAVDIAVLPFVFIAAAETMKGHRLWGIPVAMMLGFLVISHPWMLAIFGPLTLAWAFISILAPWWGGAAVRVDPIGVAIVLTVAGASLIAAVTVCWDDCGLRYEDLVLANLSAALDRISMIIGAASMVAAAAIVVLRRRVEAFQDSLVKWPMGFALRLGVSLGLLTALVIGTMPAVQNGMPEFVDLPRMFGWGVIGLAAVAAVGMPFIRGRAALPLTGLAVITYPFVIYNPLDSPYWPHRTAAYLGVGLVALSGIGAAVIVKTLRVTVEALSKRAAQRRQRKISAPRPYRSRVYSMGAIATILGATVMAGTVYAATPLEYEQGWYRLYPDCEFKQLRHLAEDARPGTVIVAGSWQAKLVMGAFSEDGMDVWYSYEMFTRADRRNGTLVGLGLEGKDIIFVIDRHMRIEQPPFDARYLDASPWEPLGAWCAEGLAHPRMTAYIARAVV